MMVALPTTTERSSTEHHSRLEVLRKHGGLQNHKQRFDSAPTCLSGGTMAETETRDCKCCQTKTDQITIPSIAAGKKFWECMKCKTVTNEPSATTAEAT